jgi:hypothetical protein
MKEDPLEHDENFENERQFFDDIFSLDNSRSFTNSSKKDFFPLNTYTSFEKELPFKDFFKKDPANIDTSSENQMVGSDSSQEEPQKINKKYKFITARENSNNSQGTKEGSIQLKKKRGRRRIPNKSERREHNKYSRDNILRKVQIHFISYLLFLFNLLLKHYNIEERVVNINTEDKRTINVKDLNSLKEKTLCGVISSGLSAKFTKKGKDHNQKICEKINDGNYKVLKLILEEKYLKFFKSYYHNEKTINLKEYSEHEEIIHFSSEPKTLDDLFNKESNRGDEKYKKTVLEVIKNTKFFMI